MQKIVLLLLVLQSSFLSAGPFTCLRKLFYVRHHKQIAVKPQVAFIQIDDDIDFPKLQQKLVNVLKDNQLQGLILHIRNYGGSTSAFATLHDLIQTIDAKKPVIAYIEAAQSAGYLIASACRYIFTVSMPDIGCLGTGMDFSRFQHRKLKDGRREADIVSLIFTAGKFKALYLDPEHEFTQEEKDYIQERCTAFYTVFLKQIAKNRNLDINTASQWADARIFTAQEALDLKLVDAVGTIVEVEQKMLEFICRTYPKVKMVNEITLHLL